jgi:clan AA aspartic protease (TIGR02281 family)
MRKLILIALVIHFNVISFSQVVIKMKREGGVSTIPCKVNGLNLKFIFDTGASDVSISMTEASFMLKNDYLSKDDIIGKSNYLDANGNISEGVNIILREIEIGGLKLFNIKASVVTNMKAPLLLGQTAISKLGVVQLDLEANTLTIMNPRDSVINELTIDKDIEQVDTMISNQNGKDDYQLLLEKANDYFDEGSYQEAITNCDIILLEQTKNIGAYFLRALSYDMLEDYKSAINDYTNLIKLDPKDYVSYCYRGKSKHDLKDYPGALSDFNLGLSINPKYTRGFKWRADTKEKMKNISGAILDYDKAISLSQMDSSLYISRANLKRESKDYKGAIIDCNKAISISPDFAEAYYFRGLAKKDLKQFNYAIDDFNQAIELNPEIPGPYAHRGNIKEEQYEDFEGAMEDYDKALELNPNYLYASLLKSFLEDKIKNNVWILVTSTSTGDKWYIYNTVASKGI